MAEENDSSQEKTEQPSAKRQKDAREKGQVVRSKDLNATIILLFSAMGLWIFGGQLSDHMAMMMRNAFEFDLEETRTPAIAFEHLFFMVKAGLVALVPVLLLIFILSLVAPLLLGGWVFSAKSFAPKWSRLSPLSGFKRIFAVKGLVEVVKSILKFLIVAFVAIATLKLHVPQLLDLGRSSVEVAISQGSTIIVQSFLFISASLVIIALIDVPFQLYEHQKSLKMTKQELKDEYKETEGKPEVKGAIRRAQQEISRRRMMAEIPKAEVILTNPTHYAVALSYKKKGKKAPVVVAKGKDLMAFQINKVAKDNKIPIICVPPLARAIYFSTKLNKEIPQGLYIAVAQVLAYIYQLKGKKDYDYKPALLQKVPIPDELAHKEDMDD